MKKLLIVLLIVCLFVGVAGAKEIHINNGVSLEHTRGNYTPESKLIIYDLDNNPPEIDPTQSPTTMMTTMETTYETTFPTTEPTPVGEEYSTTPVTDAIEILTNPHDKSSYKSHYDALYTQDIVGENKVHVGNDKVDITIYSMNYDSETGLLKLNLTAKVKNVEKAVHNPYKIYNPPMMVQTSPTTYFENGTVDYIGDFEEVPSSALLESIAYNVMTLPDGKPTFDGIDPILVVYAIAPTYGHESWVNPARGSKTDTWSQIITGVGTTSFSTVSVNASMVGIHNSSTSGLSNIRNLMIFDTTGSISESDAITNVSLNIYGQSKTDEFGISPSVGFTGYIPITEGTYTPTSDYDTNLTGSTRYSNDITYSGFSTSGYNTIYFTSTGISQVVKNGYTNVMGRLVRDIDSISTSRPTGTTTKISELVYYTSLEPGTSKDPYLSITYISSGVDTPSDFVVDENIVTDGTTITFTPLAGSSYGGNYFNWSFGDGAWSNVTTNVAQTHSYSTTNIYSPTLYIFNTTVNTLVNSTTKSDYIGVNSYRYYAAIDGFVARTPESSWNDLRNGDGDLFEEFGSYALAGMGDGETINEYNFLSRGIQTYDTSGFPTGYTITNATIGISGVDASDLYGASQHVGFTDITSISSYTNLSASDYNKFGNNIMSSNITVSDFDISGYNKFYLTSYGRASFNKTGYTPFMLRIGYDVDNITPTPWTGSSYIFAGFDASQGKSYLLVNFTPTSVFFSANTTIGMVGANAIGFTDESDPFQASWNWSFGDGTYSNVQNATHVYTSVGRYNVTLTSPAGGSDTYTRTNYINISAPEFYCSPLVSSSVPTTVTCYDTSAIITGSNRWIWGDTTVTTDGGTVSHTYTSAGDYTVSMQSPIFTGTTTTKTSYIHVGKTAPTANFISNVTEVAAGGYVQFNDTTTGTAPTSWIWDFNGGTATDSTDQNPVRQFNTVGNFSVNLTATNIIGSDSEVKTNYIRVYPAGWYSGMQPITAANFVATPYTYANVNNAINFTGSVTTGTPQWYIWSWGDSSANTYNSTSPSHTYTTAGTYTVTFTAWNAISSYPVTKTNYITIYGPGVPYAQFTGSPTSGTPGVLVSFVDQSLKGTSSGLVYNWSFGDTGYTLTPYSNVQGSVNHVYAYSGVYDVNLSITNDNGTSYQYKSQYITVSTSQSNTWYSPKQIGIKAVYRNPAGIPIPNALVELTAIGTTLPNTVGMDSQQSLQLTYGINPTVANAMLNNTLIMSGTTGSDGSIGFTVLSSIGYTCDVTDPATGIVWSSSLYPSDPSSLYTIWVGENAFTQQNNASVAVMNGTKMYLTEPDKGNITINLQYQDTSGQTTDVVFSLIAANNMTVVWSTDLGNPGTHMVLANHTVRNVRGDTYYYGYNATRSI